MKAATPKYWAFISYSHRDEQVATALQRAIETYRVPRRLVDNRTAFGEVPSRVKPIFRDRDELCASTDLKALVREALAQSRYLIVVCSPDSARSAWTGNAAKPPSKRCATSSMNWPERATAISRSTC